MLYTSKRTQCASKLVIQAVQHTASGTRGGAILDDQGDGLCALVSGRIAVCKPFPVLVPCAGLHPYADVRMIFAKVREVSGTPQVPLTSRTLWSNT